MMSALETMDKIKKLAQELVDLKIKEAKALADVLKNDHGIEPPAAIAPAVVVANGEVAEKEEEKTIFDVMLISSGNAKLGVIKVVKNLLECGLKEAKDFIDNAPQAIKEGVPKEEAEKIKKELSEAGAEVELK